MLPEIWTAQGAKYNIHEIYRAQLCTIEQFFHYFSYLHMKFIHIIHMQEQQRTGYTLCNNKLACMDMYKVERKSYNAVDVACIKK